MSSPSRKVTIMSILFAFCSFWIQASLLLRLRRQHVLGRLALASLLRGLDRERKIPGGRAVRQGLADGPRELGSVDENQAAVLLDAVVAEAVVLRDPHVPPDPVVCLLDVPGAVELPQGALVHWGGSGLVLHPLALHARGGLRLRLLVAAGEHPSPWLQVLVAEDLRHGLPVQTAHQQVILDQFVELLVVELDSRGQVHPGGRAQPLHEEERGLAVRLRVPQELCVGGLEDGVESDQLRQGHAYAPAVQRRVGVDVVGGLGDQEARPLRGAVAGGEGDGGVLDCDLHALLHATIDVDDLQLAIEHHQVFGLHVDVDETLGVQACHGDGDGLRQVSRGLLVHRLPLLPVARDPVLEAILRQLRDDVQRPVAGVGPRVPVRVPGVVEKLHEDQVGRDLLQLLAPQPLVRWLCEGLLKLFQHLDLALELLQGHGLHL
mmetsp:Transcript_109469/g.341119  ORF Transcript_109469/g.341119 Transcript_109469/m.341119 type:complete len:434 (-) Transcript_109469:258-1559(-)